MPKKKKFIDKKNSVTFHLVHRSQHDPLTVDENAPQHVLFPAANEKSAKDKIKEDNWKFGIYFDDDYNYLQHLRDVNKTNVELVETPKTTWPEKQKLNLPSSVFASTVEEKVGLLNKAAPQSGLRLDLDPDIVAAMDEDFNYSDPDNELEDNFMELANKSPSEYGDDEAEFDDENSNYSSEFGDEVESLKNLETKSRFTDYSMTSSVISRNSQLTLLDETFEQVYMNYDDVEIGALDCDEIEGELDIDSPMFQMAADQFEEERKQEKLTVEDINKLQINSSEESDLENDYLIEVKEKGRWDCESILSTYSNIYNHPKLIQEPINKIKVNKRTGIPMETHRLTKRALAQLENSTNKIASLASSDSSTEDGKDSSHDKKSQKSVTEKKIGKESSEEKKIRKKQLKEFRKERRMERKANSEAFKEEKKKLEKTFANNKLNRRGIAL